MPTTKDHNNSLASAESAAARSKSADMRVALLSACGELFTRESIEKCRRKAAIERLVPNMP
ncbi:hypothetical protein NECAME_13257 [Necator americanus]|uniref:Uncharacterized protein n=1 Tax=Necator americanus TaxID=51031 RepID=W2SWY8_NECAM|nr:hypothetical protein NECAME_13257 [Necator americanus]ETN74033.1 hypothetical protein NECAME_13257 [Necator americanus]